MSCQGKEWKVEELTEESSFVGVDIALFSATDAISREYGQRLGAAGVVVIDDSGVFRMDADVPLVVPEVNAHALMTMPRGIVSIPNCTTTPLVMALKPLHDAAGIKRVVVTTFQSVSGTGAAAMDELMTQTKDLMSFHDAKAEGLSLSDRIQSACRISDPSTTGGMFRGSEDRPRDKKNS